MMPQVIYVVLIATLLSNGIGALALEESEVDRKEKHFSLFSVVTFKNEQCTSETSLTGGARIGTCYSASECGDKGGTKSGNCAAGFGVCCVFINKSGASATITENRTHLRNAEYPTYTTVTSSTSIAYTIKKMSSDICQIRLDFTSFVLAGPANSQQNAVVATYNHLCTNDQLTVATTGNTNMYPTFCGTLTGQHLYLELSPTSSDYATVTVVQFYSTNSPIYTVGQRLWDIQTTQIPCWASYRAPNGCQQYFMTDYGKLTSYNFYRSSSAATRAANAQNQGLQLLSQNINICIRRSKGMCCVHYQVCIKDTQGIALTDSVGTASATDGTEGTFSEGWSVDISMKQAGDETYSDIGAFDAMCSDDYVEIPSSHTGPCGAGTRHGGTINTRYCGTKFGANLLYTETLAAASQSPGVCDCSEPFVVRHGSDMTSDAGGDQAAEVNNENAITPNRGFCLDFLQMPCTN